MHLILIFCYVLSLISWSEGYDMYLGDKVHKQMVIHKKVKDFAIIFLKRIKILQYTDPEKRIIKAISATDNDFSTATVNVTEGGLGYDHVTMRLKSERSHPLNYDIEIYV